MMMPMPIWTILGVTSRISTTKLNVSLSVSSSKRRRADDVALKEDDAQAALKAFRAVVDDQPEKGEW
jgi:hypothetical protein